MPGAAQERAKDRTYPAIRRIEAALFDLDGVVTNTARVHAAAWKQAFDPFLAARAKAEGCAFRPFDAQDDYRATVDGKPRFDGARDFLRSRGIDLPSGNAEDAPGTCSICAIGNAKNRAFREVLERQGVEPVEPSIAFISELRGKGIPTALVTSSRNGRAVIASAGIGSLFDCIVDGSDLRRLGLKGKPAPDLFLEALSRLGAAPRRSLLVEDSEAGILAGKAARVGILVGLGESGAARRLRSAGAHQVVASLADPGLRFERAGKRE